MPGYWEGDRGRIDHDHHWDREHDRDLQAGIMTSITTTIIKQAIK